MQAQGITYAPGVTQFYQGVTSGGAEQEFEYGGKVDQFLILDGGKLGVWPGMTMTLHAETRFGNDINFDAVGFAPANVAMLYPKEGEQVYGNHRPHICTKPKRQRSIYIRQVQRARPVLHASTLKPVVASTAS